MYQKITSKIIASIEAGCPPWRRPWTGEATQARLPLRHNGVPFRGVNVLFLWDIAARMGYNSARWMTFNRASSLGGKVRKGEKSSVVLKVGTFKKKNDAGEESTVTFLRGYRVFNADQITGLPEKYYIHSKSTRDLGTQADPELEAFFAATGACIKTTPEPSAYYHSKNDFIHMPPISSFNDADGYYATLAHEMTHWTGANTRLDRFKRLNQFQEDGYAFEELVAEVGNCFLCANLGLTPDFEQSGAYIDSWLRAMRRNSRMIVRAASEAQKATDYVLALAQDENNSANMAR